MEPGDKVIIDDPNLPTNGETAYILAKAGWWLMVSWDASPSARFIPFVLSLSQVRPTNRDDIIKQLGY